MGEKAVILVLWGAGLGEANVAHSLPLEGKVVSARIPDEVFRSIFGLQGGRSKPLPYRDKRMVFLPL